MKNRCDEDGCDEVVHENINGIRFNKCRKHYLKSMSRLRNGKGGEEMVEEIKAGDGSGSLLSSRSS